jgi:hypothetical protein
MPLDLSRNRNQIAFTVTVGAFADVTVGVGARPGAIAPAR